MSPKKNSNAKEKLPKTSKDLDVEINRGVAALSYVWILCLIPLLGKRDSAFAQFHAKQGLVLFIVELILSLVMWFPIFGQLIGLVLLVVSVLGAWKALQGEWWEAPFLHEWSKKIKI